ncbi:MAG: peptidyl-prolyl cis-trans isomerase [Longimicrobiales bacterium]
MNRGFTLMEVLIGLTVAALALTAGFATLGFLSDSDEPVERDKRLNNYIDGRLMALKARSAGMEQDPVYQKRVSEFRKTRLINLHRSKLVQEMQPDELEIEEYFEDNRERITFPEHRKVQMVVLKTKAEADEIKRKIDMGEMTIYQAAMNHSVAPNARQNLGEIGWVAKGSGFPELDKLTFSLEPGVVGGPVQSPAGWHLVKVLDVQDAQRVDISDEDTQKATRRMLIHEKLDKYAVNLRLHEFPVEVDDERLERLFAEEANWIAELTRKSDQEKSQHQLEHQIKELMGE